MSRLFAILLLLVPVLGAGCAAREQGAVQFSTLNTLIRGVYDGPTDFAAVKKRGDFGIGTVNGLDGELIGLNGRFWQVRVDGRAYELPDTARTPFATVLFFRPAASARVRDIRTLDGLLPELDRLGLVQDHFQAIHVHGRFRVVRARSVPRQEKPYPPLTEVVKSQPVFELAELEGDLVGFRSPEYAGGLQAPGLHLHFITADRTAGGHVLAMDIAEAVLEVQDIDRLELILPPAEHLGLATMDKAGIEDIRRVEK